MQVPSSLAPSNAQSGHQRRTEKELAMKTCLKRTTKDQCKHGGWKTFTNPAFKNQGDCIRYVNSLP